MTESAKALYGYIASVAAAFAPSDARRVLLAEGNASLLLCQAIIAAYARWMNLSRHWSI